MLNYLHIWYDCVSFPQAKERAGVDGAGHNSGKAGPNGRDWLTEEFHGEIMGRSCGNFGDLIINLMVFDSQDLTVFFMGFDGN